MQIIGVFEESLGFVSSSVYVGVKELALLRHHKPDELLIKGPDGRSNFDSYRCHDVTGTRTHMNVCNKTEVRSERVRWDLRTVSVDLWCR